MKNTFTFIVAAIMLSACNAPSSTSDIDSVKVDTFAVDTTTGVSDDTMTAPEKEKLATTPTTKWTYSEHEDKMTSKKTYFASIDANEELQFDFPYDGGSTATIALRKGKNGNEVLLSVSKGQFNTGVDGSEVTVRFDQNKAITFSCSEPSDNSSDLLFINNATKFIANAKKAKKMIIQAEFYQSGLQTMEFDIVGLKWDH